MTIRALMILVVAVAAVCVAGGRADAASRCNLRTIGDLEATVTRIEANTKASIPLREAALNRQLGLLAQERQILALACTEKDGPAVLGHADVVAAQIAAENAQYMLDDLGAKCGDGALAVAAGFVAQGWSALGQTRRTLLYDAAPEPGRDQAAARLRALAATTKITLPEVTEATDYWVQQIQASGQTSFEACQKK